MAPPYTWIVNPHDGPPPARLVQEVPAMAVEQTSGPRRGGRSTAPIGELNDLAGQPAGEAWISLRRA